MVGLCHRVLLPEECEGTSGTVINGHPLDSVFSVMEISVKLGSCSTVSPVIREIWHRV